MKPMVGPPDREGEGFDSGAWGDLVRSMRTFVESERKRRRIVGLSVCLVDDQTTIMVEGFGLADREVGRAVDARSVFRVGSITKLFTATAVMKLAERGRIDIDAPLSRYLPELSIRCRDDGPSPSIRSVLAHHSGLPSDRLKGFFFPSPPPKGYERGFAELPSLLEGEYASGPPGRVFAYSNLGYSLLGVVVERAGGMPFDRYMTEEILEPLGMTQSSLLVADRFRSQLAAGYHRRIRVDTPYGRDLPAGSLLSTAEDLAKFIKMIFASGQAQGGAILRPRTLEEMLTVQNRDVPLDFDFRIGLGFWLDRQAPFQGMDVAGHGGDLPPFHSTLVTLPGAKLGVAVLSSTAGSSGSVRTLSRRILALALERKCGLRLEDSDQPKEIRLSEEQARRMTGTYIGPSGPQEIRCRQARLTISFGRARLDLIPREGGRFGLRARLFRVIPVRLRALDLVDLQWDEIDGRSAFGVSAAGVFLGPMVRVEPLPIPEMWLARAGRYEPINPDEAPLADQFALVHDRERGMLFLRVRILGGSRIMALAPLSDQEAVIMGEGRNLGETVRVAAEEDGEQLLYSGYRLRKVLHDRG